MPVMLTATGFPNEAASKKFALIKPFDETGGTIGFLRGGERDTADWQLPDPDCHINQIHAIIDYQHDNYWIVDVSLNGTLVNGKRLSLDAHQISEQDQFTIGSITFSAELDPERKAATAIPLDYVIPNWIQKLIDIRKEPYW